METAGPSPVLEHMYQTSRSHIVISPHHMVTLGYTKLIYFGFVRRVRRCYQLLTLTGGDTLSQETITRHHYHTQATSFTTGYHHYLFAKRKRLAGSNNRYMQLIWDRCWCSLHLHTLATEGAGGLSRYSG
jgi:hypothetical protein